MGFHLEHVKFSCPTLFAHRASRDIGLEFLHIFGGILGECGGQGVVTGVDCGSA